MKYITRTDLFGGSVFSEVDKNKKTKIFINQEADKLSKRAKQKPHRGTQHFKMTKKTNNHAILCKTLSNFA